MDELGRIYAVKDWEDGLRIDSVAIQSETPRLIILCEYLSIPGRGTYGGNGFLRRLSKDHDTICRTPREALTAYLAVQRQKAEDMRTKLGGVESRITQAAIMLAEAEEA